MYAMTLGDKKIEIEIKNENSYDLFFRFLRHVWPRSGWTGEGF